MLLLAQLVDKDLDTMKIKNGDLMTFHAVALSLREFCDVRTHLLSCEALAPELTAISVCRRCWRRTSWSGVAMPGGSMRSSSDGGRWTM